MIKRIARDIPLFESLGVFTEAPKKRKPRVISVRPPRDPYQKYLIDDEEIDGIDDEGDDLSEYDSYLSDEEINGIDPDGDIENLDINNIPTINDDGTMDNTDVPEAPANGEGEEVIDVTDNGTPQEVPQENPAPVTPDTTPTEEPVVPEPIPDQPAPTDDGTQVDATAPAPDPNTADPNAPVDGAATVDNQGGEEIIDATAGDGSDVNPDVGVELDNMSPDGTDPSMDPNAPPQDAGTQQQQFTKDDMRKFQLFKRFLSFHTTLDYFVKKLGESTSDDQKFSYASKMALDKFKKMSEFLKDYMLLKFQSDSFLQNSFTYEKIKASALLTMELLENNKYDKSQDSKDKH